MGMNRTGRSLLSALLVLAMSGSLAACAKQQGTGTDKNAPPTGTSGQPTPGGRIVIGDIGDAESLNPIYSADTSSSFIAYRIQEGLLRIDNKLQPVGVLADKWESSNDGKTWTFHLHPNVKWHDGQPFTADDVVFTYESIMHPLYAGTRQSSYDKLVGYKEAKAKYDAIKKDQTDKKLDDKAAEAALLKAFDEYKAAGGVKKIDDNTVQFNLAEPFAPFLFNMTMAIIPKHILKDVRPDKMKEHDTNRHPIGTGPYVFKDWKKGDQIVLTANPDYWGGKVNISELVYKIIPDQNAIAVALESGAIDVGSTTPELLTRFQAHADMKIYEYQTLSYTYMGYNLRNPLFQDVKVRQALTTAMDRKAMVDAILMGHGSVANSHGSPIHWAYNPNVPTFDYNKEKAKQMLAEAGWKPGPDGILQKDGKPFKFTLATNQNKVREQVITIIQQQLLEVGIKVETKVVEWSSFVPNNLLGQDFEAIVVGWSLSADPDAYSIWHSSQTGKGKFNFVGFENKQLDGLLEKGRTTIDQTQRKQIYGDMQKILAENQPYTFLFFENALWVAKDKFKGPIEGGPSGLLANVQEWWIPKDKQ